MVIGESITIHRHGAPTGEYDELGNPIFSPPSSTASDGWAVQPASQAEDQETFGAAPVTGLRLFNRSIVDIRLTDEVTVRGDRYKVVGDSAEWVSPFGTGQVGTVVSVERGA